MLNVFKCSNKYVIPFVTILLAIFVSGEKLIHQWRCQNVCQKQYQNTRITCEREVFVFKEHKMEHRPSYTLSNRSVSSRGVLFKRYKTK